MADNSKPGGMPKPADRRTFLKVGAGVVAGAVVAGVATDAYLSGVIGSNNSSSSTTVASLQNQLSSTQQQLSSTAGQLNAAQGQVSSLSNQLTATQAQLSSASSQLSSTQQALASANGQISTLQSSVTSANGQISSLQSQVTSASSAASSAQAQATTLQTEIDTMTGFLYLNLNEQSLVEAVAEAIIPSDSNGPGAKEAGVVYFVDRQLASDYGNSGSMYMDGPFVLSGQKGPITVEGITYSGGTPPQRINAGTRFQYPMIMRYFFKYGLQALQAYANSAYGGNFETLSNANQMACLQDLWNNKPTSFNDILPMDFAYELYFIVWCGFLMDPLYGGNRNMVGWTLTGYNGVNTGDFYGEGMTAKQLMVATTPTRLKPASLAQFQKGSA